MRYEPSDYEWTAIKPMLPNKPRDVRRVNDPGAHSTLHGVVFAILCPGPAVYRRRGAALRSGHEIVSASRLRRIDPTPTHHALGRVDTYRILGMIAARVTTAR